MKTFVPLPPEFAALEGKVQWVQRINDNELHSSCPNCGIDPAKHNDSNPSDRFILWLESRETGKPFAMCYRHCGYKWTPDKQDAVWTEEEKAIFAQKRRELNQREEERIQEYARNVVMKQKIYLRYMELLKKSTYGKQWLAGRGFDSEEWNRWFGYGIIEDYKCKGYMSTYFSPAITMPIVTPGAVVENVKLRVTEAHHDRDRFRNLYKVGNQSLYLPMREGEIKNKVVLFEGEMKANYVAMFDDIPKDVQIAGTQGKGIGGRVFYALENCEVVYLCLDPDAYEKDKNGVSTVSRTVRQIGIERTRIIPCKQKVDDAIRAGFNLRNAFNMAVHPARL